MAETTGGELEELVSVGARPHEITAALVRELGGRRPAIVVLEDLHWADEATLDVVRLLARKVEAVPAIVVATYRDDGLDRTHPLTIVLGELATAPAVTRLAVPPLSAEAVVALAEPYGIDGEDLHRQTRGNPFFVTEVLATGGGPVPPTVRDAVLARVARLCEPARRLLEAIATATPHADVWFLEALAPDELGNLEECLASGMVTSHGDVVAFRHELARLAVEDALPPGRRVALHRAAAAALSAAPGADSNAARIAHHADVAGNGANVLHAAPAAAARAASVGAHREAAAQYARAVRFAGELPLGEQAELLERQQIEEAVTWSEKALALGERLDDVEACVYALTNFGAIEVLTADPSAPGKLAESLEQALRAGLAENAGRAYLNLVWWPLLHRRHALVDRYLDTAMDYCTEHGLDLWRMFLVAAHARVQLDRGQWVAAAELAGLRPPPAAGAARRHEG